MHYRQQHKKSLTILENRKELERSYVLPATFMEKQHMSWWKRRHFIWHSYKIHSFHVVINEQLNKNTSNYNHFGESERKRTTQFHFYFAGCLTCWWKQTAHQLDVFNTNKNYLAASKAVYIVRVMQGVQPSPCLLCCATFNWQHGQYMTIS